MNMSVVETIAGVFLSGAHLCIRDDAQLGVLATNEQLESIKRTGVYESLGVHSAEIREAVLAGIHQVIDGYLPALDGLEYLETDGASQHECSDSEGAR